MALVAGTHQLHVIHLSLVALYSVPVLGGALCFGLTGGVVASLVATAVFGLHVRYGWPGQPKDLAEWWSFVAVFWVVGVGGGVLVDLQRSERAKAIARERDADRRTTLEALASLAAALGAHDPYIRTHGEHVGALAAALGTELTLTTEQVETLRLAGLVHDLGKLGVPDDILLKPGDLTVEDRTSVERHPEIAAAILQPLRGAASVAAIVLSHHECPDGSGYPRHLRGSDIALEARLLRVADVFCSLTDARPYKPALAVPTVLAMMREMAGAKLDADALQALERLVQAGEFTDPLQHHDVGAAPAGESTKSADSAKEPLQHHGGKAPSTQADTSGKPTNPVTHKP
jgi:hypothetical protein